MAAPQRIQSDTNFKSRNDTTRNVRRQLRPTMRVVETTTPKVTQAGSAPSTDEQFLAQYAQAGVGKAANDDDYAKPPQPVIRGAEAAYMPTPQTAPPQPQRVRIRRQKKKPVKTGLARLRATSANIGIWSWGGFSYLFFQLPIAILSLVFLGLAMVIDTLFKNLEPTANEAGLIETVLNKIVIFTMTIAEKISSLLGFDITIVNPANFFAVTYLLVLAYGLIVLLTIYFIYKISFLRPLSGKGGGRKLGLFLLALVGYSVPVLNLWPWFLPWTIAVWWDPK